MPYLLILLVLVGCASAPQPAPAPNPADILKSTVKIESHFMKGNASVGSGTVVDVEETPAGFEYTILTAEHVIKPSPIHLVIGLSIIINDRDVTGQTKSMVKTWLMSDAYTVLSVNGSDLALIKFWSPQQLPVLVAKQDAISPILETSRIFAAGNSYGHGPFLYEGRVGSLVTTQDYPIKPLYTASIQWDAGASGGGIYNADLELIGVVIAELGDLGFFLPLNAEANHGGNVVPIKDLIDGMRLIEVPLPKHVPYIEGSNDYKLVDRRPLDLPSGGSGGDDEEEDMPETIDFYGGQYEGSCFVFVLDASGSMGGPRWNQCLQETTQSVMSLSRDAEFSIIVFNTGVMAWSEVPKRADLATKQAALAWLALIEPDEATCTHLGVIKGLEVSSFSTKPASQRRLIAMSDGVLWCNMISEESAIALIAHANASQVRIDTIGVEVNGQAQQFLQQIASGNGGQYRQVQ